MDNNRRRFLTAAAILGIPTLAVPTGQLLGDDRVKKPDDKKDEEEVSAAEDLMREHGVLNRILLIYEEGLQ